MSRRAHSSQETWTEAEALERAGKAQEAIGLFAKAALAEEEDGEPLRARLLWEEIGKRTGATGTLLERLAMCSGKARLAEDASWYWKAAAEGYTREGRQDDAQRAADRAKSYRSPSSGAAPPPLAEQALKPR